MKINRLKWLGIALLAVLGYQGCCRFFDTENKKFIQNKTGIVWPEGTREIRVFEMPGFIRTHWVEAFVILPRDAVNKVLHEHFTPYDPRYARGAYECEQDHLNWERWAAQKSVFNDTNNPLHFFVSRDKIPSRTMILGPHIYYATGDKTGENSYRIAVDSLTGNMWIHVSYPE